ncbi:MAG: lysylphosphatidylglycerol synthase transmembrane domain-containing protein [Chloroflexi bacterium]|nr:lysylphosphatidylglycerol synthase transmembrane domain-containing protein [Chloroflexota bacterium]
MRKLLVSLAVLLGIFFAIDHFAQIESIAEILKQGDWRFFGLALVAEMFWFVATAATYQSVLGAVGVERKLLPLMPIVAASNFVSVVAPSGGMSSIAVIVADARRAGFSSAYATISGFLFVLLEYVGFTFFLIVGLGILLKNGGLNGAEIFATGFLWLSAAILASMLYLGMRSETRLAKALSWGVRLVNRFVAPFKRKGLQEDRANEFAHKIAEGLIQVKKNPRKLLPALLGAVSSKALMLVVFWLMFLAFKIPHSTNTLFAGFALAYLFTIVSPTPAGIGVVEGLVTIGLVSMSVPVTSAAVVILGYRAITFWLRLLVGMLAMQRVGAGSSFTEINA